MAVLQEGLQVNEGRYFTELNFHPLRLREELREWLIDPTGLPLVLQGEKGVGRLYSLQAACYNQELHDLPWAVLSMNGEQLNCSDPQQMIQWLLKEQEELRKRKIDWKSLLTNHPEIQLGPLPGLSLTLIIKSSETSRVARTLLDVCTVPRKSLLGGDPFAALRRLLKIVLADCNLILHIKTADLLDVGTVGGLLNLRELLDRAAMTEQRHGRLLFACSCSPDTRPADLLSRRNDEIHRASVQGISERDLRACLDQNFPPNCFGKGQIAGLHLCGRAREEDRLASSSRIAGIVGELLKEKLLIWDEDCWQFNPHLPDSVNEVLGSSFLEQYQQRLDIIESDDLRKDVDQFIELAALCPQWIPVQLLIGYMKLNEERAELLVDCLDDLFVDTEPALLVDEQYGYPGFAEFCAEQEIALYRFAAPMLAASQRPKSDPEKKAEELLGYFEKKLPKSNRVAAALCWQLAEQAGMEVQERWRERLGWYFEPKMARRFADTLLARMEAGLVSPRALLNRAEDEIEQQPVHLLQAIICACDRWYEVQGGVPGNLEGALFFGMFGSLLDDLGYYEEALEKHESAFAIRQRILPEDHPNIGVSLNNIGVTLDYLGRYEESLEKHESAFAIWQRVLPEEHPNIALSLDNIGVTMNYLSRHDEALEKYESAFAIRQRVLSEDHPDITVSLSIISYTLNNLGRHEEALKKQEAALAIRQRVFPAVHPDIAISLSYIGKILNNFNRQGEALIKLKAALDIQQRVFPEGHPLTAITLRGIGNALTGLEQYKEALKNYQAALGIQERMLPAEHPETAKTRKLLQACQEKMAEARNV